MNILVIGDTHMPFEHKEYLKFCKKIAKKYKCKEIVHIGDLVDNHVTSHWGLDPDGRSAIDELQLAKQSIQNWHKAFPKMKVCIGNHSRRIEKTLLKAGVTTSWLKSYNTVYDIPESDWEFRDHFIVDGIRFTHGDGNTSISSASKRALNLNQSIVSGHQHSKAVIQYLRAGEIFSMIIGCGIDDSTYAFNYARDYADRSVLSCGVIVDGLPIIEIMK